MFRRFQLNAKRRSLQRKGASAIEFAAVAPIFIFFCAVCFDFSRLSLARHAVQNSAYRAARIGMMEGVTRADTVAEVNEYLGMFGLEPREGSVRVGQVLLDDDGHALPPDFEQEFGNQAVEFHVEVAVPFENAAFIIPTSWLADKEFSAQIRVRSERYSGFFNAAQAYAD